ncbi:hypothetical protein [Veillonella rogosae]|uniref:hypothetical protein n=1 Tax=Veillonella rogosae TaxID=423477 RepID=UPI0020924581|nr:hypothetical protein [Veillonella rogosae]
MALHHDLSKAYRLAKSVVIPLVPRLSVLVGGRSLYWIIFSHHIRSYHVGCGGGRAYK